MTDLDRLGAGKYLLVTTFRKNGTPVPTPVWVARDGERLVFWTVTDSGKVKRIRRNGAVEVGECDMRGNPTGSSIPGTATLLDADGSEQARKLIARKYGVIGQVIMMGSRIRRGRTGTVGVAVTVS
jgi:PPOX class probable F420-dependent enzyme